MLLLTLESGVPLPTPLKFRATEATAVGKAPRNPAYPTVLCWASVLSVCGWAMQRGESLFGSRSPPFVLDLVRSMDLHWSELQSDFRVLSSLISVPLGSSDCSVCPNRS